LKGWSCCKKRVSDFDEFLNIPGCTSGRHTDEKPVQPAPVAKPDSPAPSTTKDGIEVYSNGAAISMANHTPTPTTVAEAAENTEKKAKPLAVEVLPEEDDLSVPVKVGTTCKRRGCGVTYKDEASSRGAGSEAACFHHPGAPIFHEGSKGWSCCPRKVLEFEEFLKIKGCKEGKHLFVGGKSNVCIYCDSMNVFFSVKSNHLSLRVKRKNWLNAEMIGTKLPLISSSAFLRRTRRIHRLPLRISQ
jgi:hypothetical protein